MVLSVISNLIIFLVLIGYSYLFKGILLRKNSGSKIYNLDYEVETKDGKVTHKTTTKDTNDVVNYVKFYLAPKFED